MASAELALVNKVEMRIALASTDAKLESLLKVYLAPLLLKLISPHPAVRNKVVSICNHINTRVKSSSIVLPAETLLAQFKNPQVEGDAALMRSFCLMYIQMTIVRLPAEQQTAILPDLLKGISSYDRTFQKTLFSIVLKVLPQWKAPDRGSTEADNIRSAFGFDESPADAEFLSKHFTSLLMLNYSAFSGAYETPEGLCCPGVPPSEFEFLTSNSRDTIPSANLVPIKMAALRFSQAVLTEKEQFWPAFVGSQENINEIANAASDMLKRITVDYEDEDIVKGLFDLYLGTEDTPPVNPQFGARILQLLCKSARAANDMSNTADAIQFGITSENPRLRSATVEFVNWVVKIARPETIKPVAKDLVETLKQHLQKSGYIVSRSANSQELRLRGFAYVAMGSLIKRAPDILKTDFDIIKSLFDSLQHDNPDLRNSIHESLSSLIPVLDTLDQEQTDKLKPILLEQINLGSEHSNCQFLALRFCIAALPFSDPVARYICILGLNPANRADVISEAKKGLHPYYFQKTHRPEFKFGKETFDGPEYDFPEFSDMLATLEQMWSTKADDGSTSFNVKTVPPPIFVSSLQFARQILLMKAVEKNAKISIIDEGWSHKLDEAVAFDDGARQNVTDLLATWHSSEPALRKYTEVAFSGFASQISGMFPAGEMWMEILSMGPKDLVSFWTARVSEFEALSVSVSSETRVLAGHALGILCTSSQLPDESIKGLITKLMQNIEDSSNLPRAHGATISLSYIISRLQLKKDLAIVDESDLQKYLSTLLKNLEKQSVTALREASISAISQLGAYGVLSSLPQADLEKASDLLMENVKSSNNDRAMQAFGNLYACSPDVDVKIAAAERIFALHESKQIEFLLGSGEALTCIGAGWDSTALRRTLDVCGFEPPTVGYEALNIILDKVLEFSKTTKPSLKKSSCIWLLSLVQFCGHLEPVVSRLKLMHFAFLGFLGDREDIVQESASRGLGLVYEKGDSRLKDDLVHSLVQSFTSDSRTSAAGRVSAETQLFDPGVLNTGDGSVSTYKDIMNLAAEAGDPSLIYKFMSLASSSAIWSTRKGAAFGLGSILAKTNLADIFESNPRLAKNLIPKLYRYRYDPNMAVQQSMRGIWNALVSDSASIIESQFDDILEELLKRMGDREWRVRQASAAALQDLLDSSQPSRYSAYLERIWTMSFRSLDDIKESVRTQGVSLCRSLANSLVRIIDVEVGASTQNAEETLTTLLPFLIGNSGLQSQAQEVQMFSLETLLKLIQKGGSGLRPFIPTLLEEMLGLLSTLEPQAANYIALNADKYGMTANAIDATRLASIRASPMMDAVDRLIDVLDAPTMKLVAPKLLTVIRKSVGLPSKVASSRVLVTLVVRHMDLIKPYADRFMKSCIAQLSDRNDTIVSSFASAAGYLARLSSDDRVLELVAYSEKLYFEGEEERHRQISGSIILALSKHAPDRVTSLASSILPFVFIAKHDQVKSIREPFEHAWSEHTGGVGAIKLYFGEILEIARDQLENQRWIVRQTAALSVTDASNLVGNQISQTEELFTILIKASTGRSWDGKEKVVDGLCALATKMKGFVDRDVQLRDKLLKVFTVEAGRNNKEYATKARKALEKFCGEFNLPVPATE
ncbi:proteasome stabiliser-domain-containing protein [Myxozyma melibiosi]|uniref:Proteasome stabiliser-domain-containing protein n=1 Tax=Myxozyma melibiosi TaxID=54550 RepID=A0ABR1EZZ3_9ASCO